MKKFEVGQQYIDTITGYTFDCLTRSDTMLDIILYNIDDVVHKVLVRQVGDNEFFKIIINNFTIIFYAEPAQTVKD